MRRDKDAILSFETEEDALRPRHRHWTARALPARAGHRCAQPPSMERFGVILDHPCCPLLSTICARRWTRRSRPFTRQRKILVYRNGRLAVASSTQDVILDHSSVIRVTSGKLNGATHSKTKGHNPLCGDTREGLSRARRQEPHRQHHVRRQGLRNQPGLGVADDRYGRRAARVRTGGGP